MLRAEECDTMEKLLTVQLQVNTRAGTSRTERNILMSQHSQKMYGQIEKLGKPLLTLRLNLGTNILRHYRSPPSWRITAKPIRSFMAVSKCSQQRRQN